MRPIFFSFLSREWQDNNARFGRQMVVNDIEGTYDYCWWGPLEKACCCEYSGWTSASIWRGISARNYKERSGTKSEG